MSLIKTGPFAHFDCGSDCEEAMPQITVYIPKYMDEAWRETPQIEREVITAAVRSLLRRKLGLSGIYADLRAVRASGPRKVS